MHSRSMLTLSHKKTYYFCPIATHGAVDRRYFEHYVYVCSWPNSSNVLLPPKLKLKKTNKAIMLFYILRIN